MDIPQLDAKQSTRRSDGLAGQWLGLDEIQQLEPFKQIKKAKLNANLFVPPGKNEPEVKAAVRREFQPGEIICRAGEYGSTAFYLVEGRASAQVPQRSDARPVPGRTPSGLGRLARLFARRTRRRRDSGQSPADLGEVSRWGHWVRDRPPAETSIAAGELFGIDACINHYPREATVRAVERCVVVELLRSLLDTLRESSAVGERIESGYAIAAVRSEIAAHPLFDELNGEQVDALAAAAALLDNDSDEIADDLIYREGDAAETVYLVRSGTIRLSRQRQGQEVILFYLGRGAAFGLENLAPVKPTSGLALRCVSPPGVFADVEVQGTVTLGRKASCTLTFPREHLEVSKLHCRLEERDGDVYLVDNGSKNFTLLNGERVGEAVVVEGDVIGIVDFVFELVGTSSAETGVAAASRRSTALGLDSFEVVRIPGAAIRRAAHENAGFARAAVERAPLAPVQEGPVHAPEHVRGLVELNLYNSQNTLLIDLDRCTRCDECVRACAESHDGVARFTRDGPRFGNYLVTLACRSCTDPKCMVGCPVGSIRRRDSLEIHIEDWCIGCQRCANQCPFGNINMVELARQAEEPPRLRATVCDLCSGYDGPNCVYACPHDAAIRVNPAAFLSPLDR